LGCKVRDGETTNGRRRIGSIVLAALARHAIRRHELGRDQSHIMALSNYFPCPMMMASVTRYVGDTLRLTVIQLKSAVDRPMNRKFLGSRLRQI
jgi:hypothetical protein